MLLLFHLYSTTSSSERSVLSAIFTSGTAAKHRVHFYYDFVPFVLFFFLLTPVRGFNPYSVVDLLNVLSSSGVTCAPSPQLITAGGGGGGGRRVETEIMLNCSHCCFLKKKKGYTQQGIPTMILKMVLIIISEIKRLASFALLTVWCLSPVFISFSIFVLFQFKTSHLEENRPLDGSK